MVPSEDYSHAPPCCAVFFVKGERPKPNRESTKKKTMKTNTDQKTKSGLLNRPEPLGTAKPKQIDFRRRAANRVLENDARLRVPRITPENATKFATTAPRNATSQVVRS